MPMLIAAMIGTGIFISTGAIAETLPTPRHLLVWLYGGLLVLRAR
jgi:amino acid transporter